MQLKFSSLSIWVIAKAIVKIPNKVPCNLNVNVKDKIAYLYGSEVTYLFQTSYVDFVGDARNIQIPYACLERLAKLKKKDVSKFVLFEVLEKTLTLKILDDENKILISFFVNLNDDYEDWTEFYKPDFLNDLLFLTPEQIGAIANVVKNQNDVLYHLFLPCGFYAVGNYQITRVAFDLNTTNFKTSPNILSSTFLNALLAVDGELAISSMSGEYLKSQTYCVTLPPPKIMPETEDIISPKKLALFNIDWPSNLKLDDCLNIASYIEKAATVDNLYDLCCIAFDKESKQVKVVFYKDLEVASESYFDLLEEPSSDLVIYLRVKNLISALKMAKTDAFLEFVNPEHPIHLKLDDLTETYIMPSHISNNLDDVKYTDV